MGQSPSPKVGTDHVLPARTRRIVVIWKPVPGYEGVYEVSSSGLVKSSSGVLAVAVNTGGYPVVYLYRNNKRREMKLHKLLALVFIPNPDSKKIVCHRDDDKLNFRLSNLYWGDDKSNSMDRARNGKVGGQRLMPDDVRAIRNQLGDHKFSLRESHTGLVHQLAQKFKVSASTIYNIKDGKSWSHIT
jgi:hypothetical protein